MDYNSSLAWAGDRCGTGRGRRVAATWGTEFERLIRRDPARRGLVSSEETRGPLCPGHLAAAAAELAARATTVGIVTGFYIPLGEPPAAETDGPPGAALLASVCAAVGITPVVITDTRCAAAVRVALEAWHAPPNLWVWDDQADPAAEFFAGPGRSLSHLVAIERVGPSHTCATLAAQPRAGAPPIAEFEARVPVAERDRCHNMRGLVIDDWTAPLHRLFEALPWARPGAVSIGVGDGGNEIGMGAIAWEELAVRLTGDAAALLPCRIAADWNIIAGTSNWGAYALAAGLAVLRGRIDVLTPYDTEFERTALARLVAEGPAVDGVTRRREATVDGLPFLTYLQPWLGMRHWLGLPE